jgi:hypothetical protein
MRKIIVNEDVYEIDVCHHCGEDTLELVEGTHPWNNVKHWYCNTCDSTYYFNDETICIKV